MQDQINNLPKMAKDKHKENKTFFAKLKKKPPKQLDYLMQELHQKEFERTDCLNVPIAAKLQVLCLRIRISDVSLNI
jgi:hypothetical protein